MESANDCSQSIAVIWYDGMQECNVMDGGERIDGIHSKVRSSSCVLDMSEENINEILTLGIDNAAFDTHSINENNITSDENASISSSEEVACSSRTLPRRTACRSSSYIEDTSNLPCCSNKCVISINRENNNTNSADETHDEADNSSTKKGSPIHPKVYLIGSDCEISDVCACATLDETNADVTLHERILSQLPEDIRSSVLTSSGSPKGSKIHIIKRNLVAPVPFTPGSQQAQSSHISSTQPSSTGVLDDLPPHYSTLRYMFIEDEPPKYEQVTGIKLAMEEPPKINEEVPPTKWRRRGLFLSIAFSIVAIALLVFLW